MRESCHHWVFHPENLRGACHPLDIQQYNWISALQGSWHIRPRKSCRRSAIHQEEEDTNHSEMERTDHLEGKRIDHLEVECLEEVETCCPVAEAVGLSSGQPGNRRTDVRRR